MSHYCRICGSTHSSDAPCPSDAEIAARILAESADSDRARTVNALRADLAAAIQRAEQAEREKRITEQHLGTGRTIQDGLRSDLAAARRERDRLRELLTEIANRLENDDLTYAQGNLLAKRIRAALGKSDAGAL